jgi:Raf kinase inhibitor-like YbhB/YbcL family protein
MSAFSNAAHIPAPDTLTLTSSSFTNGTSIPQKYTCSGANISPHLQWAASSNARTKSYVLIVDDPDAQRVVGKTFVHWIVVLPAHVTHVEEGASRKESSRIPGIELMNDGHGQHYTGPCPPKGSGAHTYRFTLFALDQKSNVLKKNPALPKAPFTAEQFEHALQSHIVAKGLITGTYTLDLS